MTYHDKLGREIRVMTYVGRDIYGAWVNLKNSQNWMPFNTKKIPPDRDRAKVEAALKEWMDEK